MEEKKLDINSIIGFVLIGLILIWVIYNNRPTEEALQQKEQQEQVEKTSEPNNTLPETGIRKEENTIVAQDSAALANYKSTLGAFAGAASSKANTDVTVLENEVVHFKVSHKGGQIVMAKMKNFVTYDSIPVYLVKDDNASFTINFQTSDNRTINTEMLYFEPEMTQDGDNKVLSMKLKVSENQFLEYRYALKPNDYMIDFTVRSQGLSGIVNGTQPIVMDWKLKGIRHAKSITYENRYTRLTYQNSDGKTDKLSPSGNDEETEENIRWLAYRQHFFSTILATDTPFKDVALTSEDFVEEESKDAQWTKKYTASIPVALQGGEFNYGMHWYYGPTDVNELEKYDLNLEDAIPFGWGIFGWINKQVFTPLYGFLSSFFPYGIAIIVMTILVRLVLSPVTYKSYLSQAKMKVLRPEITEINEKFKDEPMKRQQETMKLYNKAGVSPLSGCVPALLQLPVFYALFMFFPTAFALRQKSFLWAEDLSAYDTVAELPFPIPFYGDHVSLFPILASIAIFIYMMMTTGQNTQMQQPGMPNMKFIIYLSPLLMLFFFNNYASGLSLYYFISNLITIFIMLAIKKFILDEEKIHAKIEMKKKQPKKENRFQKKMREMMEQAEQQKQAQRRKK